MDSGHPSALQSNSIFLLGFAMLGTIFAFGYSGIWIRNRALSGILLGNAQSPSPFEAPPSACWAFGLCTLAELFLGQFSGMESLTLIYYGQVFLGLVLLAFFSRQPDPFGWLRVNPLKALAIGVIGGSAVFVGTTMITELEQGVASLFHYKLEEQTVVKQLKQMKDTRLILNMLLNAVILAPLAEELFFRGFLYTALKKLKSPVSSMVISGTVFGMIHWSPFGFIPLTCMGIALALTYETTGSILASIAIHGTFNLISCLLILYQSFLSS